MAGNKTRNEIIYHSIVGSVVLTGTVALMLFGVGSTISADIGPLLAGLALSTYVFRFGLPWNWLNFLFLASFLVVGMLLGQPGLMWCGGYIAGSNVGAVWRMATVKPKIKSKWTVDDQGFATLTEARKAAREVLNSLDGTRERVVIEHGSSRFEVTGSLPSKLVCHRNHDADDEKTWAVLSNPTPDQSDSVEVPMGRTNGSIPSRFVNNIATVETALAEFLKSPKSETLGPEWVTDEMAFDLRLSS